MSRTTTRPETAFGFGSLRGVANATVGRSIFPVRGPSVGKAASAKSAYGFALGRIAPGDSTMRLGMRQSLVSFLFGTVSTFGALSTFCAGEARADDSCKIQGDAVIPH